MNKNVLAATGGLDKSKTLCRVEPLHSTFSHHVVSAGSKNKIGLPVPANRHVRRPHDTRYGAGLIAQTMAPKRRKSGIIGVFTHLSSISRPRSSRNAHLS